MWGQKFHVELILKISLKEEQRVLQNVKIKKLSHFEISEKYCKSKFWYISDKVELVCQY